MSAVNSANLDGAMLTSCNRSDTTLTPHFMSTKLRWSQREISNVPSVNLTLRRICVTALTVISPETRLELRKRDTGYVPFLILRNTLRNR